MFGCGRGVVKENSKTSNEKGLRWLQQHEMKEAHMESPEGNCKCLDILKGSHEDKTFEVEENDSMMPDKCYSKEWSWLRDKLVCALGLEKGEIRVEVVDMFIDDSH